VKKTSKIYIILLNNMVYISLFILESLISFFLRSSVSMYADAYIFNVCIGTKLQTGNLL